MLRRRLLIRTLLLAGRASATLAPLAGSAATRILAAAPARAPRATQKEPLV